MRNHVAFQTQLASIMEALAKAAVTEIRTLVEDGSVELRLEVSRSHKEIDRLRRKIQQVEGELRTAQEAAAREIRSVGVQAEEQFEGAAGGTGAVKCGTDAPFVEQLDEKKCEAQTCDRGPGFGSVVKEEGQEEELEAQILHLTESEDSAGRLNNVGSEYVTFEMDPQLWRSFTQGNSDVTDDPVCSVTEQCSQGQSVLSPKRLTPATIEMSGSTLSCLGKDNHVLDGGFMKEEAGGQCLYRSEMVGTQVMEHEYPPFSTNDNLTSQVFHPVQQQLDLRIGVTENRMDTVSSCNQNARISRRCGSGEKHHSCALCQKNFNHFSTLVRHQRVHTGEKPFICAECGKRFTSRSNLIRHERVHTGNKPFDCAQCGRRFSLRSNLIRHERVHTGNKPFGCVLCGKRFARGSNLREHNRIHTGERPYHCTQCGKSFTQLSGLKSHLKTHSRNDLLELCKT